MSVALLQEVRFAIGFKHQADLVTPQAATDMWSLRHTNTDLIQSRPINEDDSADLGKGVYVTQTFPSHIEAGGPFNGRISSESMTQIAAFGMGKVVKVATTATGGFLYTMHEPTFATDGIDLPVCTAAIQIRTGGSAITDKAIVGLCCTEWGFSLKQGPGRDNATFNSTWVGTGQYVKPSTITMPALTTEHSMNAGNVTALTLLGFDYLSNKRFVNVDFKWQNNLRDTSSYFPSSGAQSGYQLRGRMRRGAPTITLTAQVECDSGSSEEDALLAQTVGTGVITMLGSQIASGPESHQFKITFYALTAKATPISDADGIAAYQIEYFIQQDPTNGVMKVECICTHDSILTSS
jgi:hypothetical protein